MIPYIEFNGKTYEFIATFRLQKEYRKELRSIEAKFNSELLSSLGNDGIAEIRKVQEALSKAKTEEEKNEIQNNTNLNLETMKLAIDNMEKQEDILFDLNEKYCFEMINKKYNLNTSEWDEIENTICQEKGFDYIKALFDAICRKVFSVADKGTPQETLTFDWDKEEIIN